MTSTKKPTEDPIESMAIAMAFSSRDWGADPRDAWIYGIVCGWDEAFAEVAAKHRWTEETQERLKRLRSRAISYSKSQRAEG